MIRITITDLDNGAEVLNLTTNYILASISSPEDDSTIQVIRADNCNAQTLLAGLAGLRRIEDVVGKKLFEED